MRLRAEAVRAMQRQLEHRGPDAAGEFHDADCSLAMRRLSIIDLTGGHQPLFNETGEIVCICNGELYGFQDARRRLEQMGHTFATHSDTEVAVHSYERMGDDFPTSLNGMFALALWDRPRRRLLLARDRVGKKPLYYTVAGGALAFASELRSLLALPARSWTVDAVACREFLSLGYMPGDRTPIAEIRRLPPGCTGIWEGDRFSVRRYWAPTPAPSPATEAEAQQTLCGLLESAVALRLISDVPIGAFVSGGLDSSMIVAIAAGRLGARIPTFNIAIPGEPDHDEAPHARRLAAHFGCEHHEIPVASDSFRELPDLVWALDEPLADPAALPTLLLSREARRSVTVALTGEGADEVFAGYERYSLALYGSAWTGRVGVLRGLAARTLRSRGSRRQDDSRVSRLLRAVATGGSDALAWSRSVAMAPGLQVEEPVAAAERLLESSSSPDVSARLLPLQLDDFASLLPNGLLTKVDRMTMAASLEARCPYLDYRVVDFGLGLPDAWKIRGRTTKVLLRRLARTLLPAEIPRRPKHTFRVPLAAWLRGPLQELTRAAAASAPLRQFGALSGDRAPHLAEDHIAGRADFSRALWAIITLHLWLSAAGQHVSLDPAT
jgi:asparagine synthase (glutamine-hydrolysing)